MALLRPGVIKQHKPNQTCSLRDFKKNDDKKSLCSYYGELFNTVHDRKTAFAYTPCSIYICKNAFNIDIAVHTYITIFIILIPSFDPLT